jgi:hypothetical protein
MLSYALDGMVYTINAKLGEGAFAKVYHISVDEATLQYALEEGKVVKVCMFLTV